MVDVEDDGPYSRGGNFARPAMSAAVSIALWTGAGLTISAILAAIAVAVNRRMRIVDPAKGIDLVICRRSRCDRRRASGAHPPGLSARIPPRSAAALPTY
jgi:hypothetical protein